MSDRYQLTLASASAARAQLLKEDGYQFSIRTTNSEDNARQTSSPQEYCIERALLKARAVAQDIERGVIVGADTIALCNNCIIGKPSDTSDAITTLKMLSSNPHEVITGIAVIVKPEGYVIALSESTRVFMRPMTIEEITQYVASGEAMGKAGSYAVQETGDKYIERFEGSFSNVVGLPMELFANVLEILENRGIFLLK